MRILRAYYRRRARHHGVADGEPGAVTAIQRFGSALNLNVHFHTLFLDGVFTREASGALRFVAMPPPTPREIARLVATIARRVRNLTRRHGVTLADDDSCDEPATHEDAGALASLAAASVTGRSLPGATPGTRVSRIGRAPTVATERASSPWHARAADFDLHGGRTVCAEDRRTLERLCHYLLRPPLAQERIELLRDGRIGLTLAHPWADGTHALVFGGVEFLEKLAVLIPKPKVNLLIYHGILGARAGRRAAAVAQAVLPAMPPPAAEPPAPATAARTSAAPRRRPSRRTWAWADLMRRVFEIDVLACICGARLRFIATIEDPAVVQRILVHLGLPARTAVPAPARAPPRIGSDLAFEFPP